MIDIEFPRRRVTPEHREKLRQNIAKAHAARAAAFADRKKVQARETLADELAALRGVVDAAKRFLSDLSFRTGVENFSDPYVAALAEKVRGV